MIRTTRSWRVAAAATAAGLALTACGTTDDSGGDERPAATAASGCTPTTLAFLGP